MCYIAMWKKRPVDLKKQKVDNGKFTYIVPLEKAEDHENYYLDKHKVESESESKCTSSSSSVEKPSITVTFSGLDYKKIPLYMILERLHELGESHTSKYEKN